MAPQLLPWLVLLALLALKPNRCAAAWLVGLPLGAVLVGAQLSAGASPSFNFFPAVLTAFGYGLTAVWLLSGCLRRSHRFLTFLCVLFALAGFSAFDFCAAHYASLGQAEWLSFAMFLGIGVLVSAVALSVAGWLCRRRYRAWALYPWLLASLLVVWTAIALPFFIIAMISSNSGISWLEFLLPVGCVTAGNYALLLPFLILSSACSLYRERLQHLLHVPPASPPALPTT